MMNLNLFLAAKIIIHLGFKYFKAKKDKKITLDELLDMIFAVVNDLGLINFKIGGKYVRKK